MKNILLLIIFLNILTISSCVYDPPSGCISILNYTDSAIYVYVTCSDTLPKSPPLVLFLNLSGHDRIDESGNKMGDTISPDYRINAHSHGLIKVSGTPDKPHTFCDNDSLILFFIKEIYIRTKTWDEICKNRVYEKQMIFSQNNLDSVGWKITYK
jgi:hypothetical protein